MKRSLSLLLLCSCVSANADSVTIDFGSLLSPGSVVAYVSDQGYLFSSSDGFNVVSYEGITEISPVDFVNPTTIYSIEGLYFDLDEINIGSDTPVDICVYGSLGSESIMTADGGLQYGYDFGLSGPISIVSDGPYELGPVFLDTGNNAVGCNPTPEPSGMILALLGISGMFFAYFVKNLLASS